ncbi:sigma-54-dependent Fis family transcriptional regulator [Ensifer sp. ENS10]|uniref:sigma-54-dependent Fis family transcriptional regulator n=1 Tax=Ensifer sp. ENS10 TaxID=2769286 RepID=UPI00177B3291|nr:sigma-54-dependent Fis family transcriptional regulator [Ensifer sp. ENS10]MBD9510355.1 sigma-54-dependent Fis family transcriptional regulator [Ensifer sp. ENS10]
MITPLSHMREIERVGLGAASPRDAPVVQSWLRCLNDYKLDPTIAQEAYIVPGSKLREHREQAEELIRIGRSGLEGLFNQVAEQNYVLLLSDARGVTVDFMGDPTFDNQLRKAGLYLGSEWSESRAGTCAVGACIVSGEPVIIHQDDHFDASHIGLTCTAAPVFDTLGDLTAVLDISQLRSPTAKASQQLALHLVSATARRIELANLMTRTRNDWVLRLARSPEFLDVDPDAAIALDGSGRITGMTHGGFGALARSMNIRGLRTRDFLGLPVSEVFDIDVDDLPNFMRGRPNGERLLRAKSGLVLFASAIAPVVSLRTPAGAEPRLPRALRDLSRGDAAMERVQTRAAKLATRNISILIQGETGSGKEYLARAIHDSCGGNGNFVAVNCAAIPEHLIESELFGYAPGAFTGASQKGKRGLIEDADGGTLFLDEIGDMPLSLQSRLLRVLSENEVQPVGALKARPIRLRVVSASHRDLAELVKEGRFREDLYYRLNAATLCLPALRERQDLGWLIDQLLARIEKENNEPYRIDKAARTALLAHEWPGNLRELSNVLRVAAALSESGLIDTECLPEHLFAAAVRSLPGEDDALKQALRDCGDNVSALARKLGVNRSTIHRRLKRLN